MESEESIKIIVGIILFVFAFGAKLVIGKDTEITDLHKAMVELPMNIYFLSLSLFFAFNVKAHDHFPIICVAILAYVIFAMAIIFLTRKCQKHYDFDNKKATWIKFLVGNLFLSLLCIVTSIFLLLSSAQTTQDAETALKKQNTHSLLDSSLNHRQ